MESLISHVFLRLLLHAVGSIGKNTDKERVFRFGAQTK